LPPEFIYSVPVYIKYFTLFGLRSKEQVPM